MRLSHRWAGAVLVSLCAICLTVQVLVRPAVGMADNGDFAKMAGPLALGPQDPEEAETLFAAAFTYRYIKDDRYLYNSPFKDAAFLSSEFFLVKLARAAQKIVQPGPRFNIRWLGAVNAIFYLLAIALWIYALSGRWRIYGGLFVILVWTDVAYVDYLNSFYMDTSAIISLVLAIAAGLHFVKDHSNRIFPVLMVLAGTLFVASKAQHVLPGLLLVPLFLAFAIWSRDRVARLTWIGGSVLLAIGAYTVIGRVSEDWRRVAVFNAVFMHITPRARDPLRTLQDLGLGRKELPFVGMHAFLTNSPMQKPDWARAFSARCNYRTLLFYYLTRPSETADLLYGDLSQAAPEMRPYADRSLEDGFPPYSTATRFIWWTGIRAFLLRHAPWHVILLTCATLLGALWLIFRSPPNRPFAALVLTTQTLAALEFAIASLADGVDINRHLITFHAATEISILLFAILVSRLYRCAVASQSLAVPGAAVSAPAR